MPGIGDTLREARMRQRIDITDVEAATKIRAKYLRALENEEFDLIHGSTFVRSFLKTYAQYLGLDATRLLEEYRTRHEPRDEELHPHIAPLPRGRDRRRPPRSPGPGALIVAGVVGVLVLLLVLGLTGGDDDRLERRPADTAAERSEEGDAAERAEREREARRRARERAERRRATSVELRIAPREATYVCVDRGPETGVLFEGTISSPRTFRGRRVRINLGRPSAVVSVNGRRVSVGGGSNPVGFDFRPRRRTPIPIGERPCA